MKRILTYLAMALAAISVISCSESKRREALLMDWRMLWPKPYDKCAVDPYTRTRVILMNGTEFEANWFSHQFARHTDDNDLRRSLALTRAIEKEQQLKNSLLKPINESVLEHTIGYEQLAVDLTAELAKRAKRVVAIELDERLREILPITLGEFSNVILRCFSCSLQNICSLSIYNDILDISTISFINDLFQ